MRAWLRRLLGLTSYPEHDPEVKEALHKRVDELEESLEYLWLAHKKLRGRVTGGLRGEPGDTGTAPGDTQPVRGNPAAIELLRKRGRL